MAADDSEKVNEGTSKPTPYRTLASGVHISFPPTTYAPLFVWHVGVWKDANFPTNLEEAIKFRIDRLTRIDTLLADIYLRLCINRKSGKSRTRGVTDFTTASADTQENVLRLF